VECAYAAALDKIASILVPEAWDPWPRHTEHSGASIAVTLAAYRLVGGMPPAPIAEDRRFFAALRAAGARIRHAPEIAVVVSGASWGERKREWRTPSTGGFGVRTLTSTTRWGLRVTTGVDCGASRSANAD